ncbi:TniQ family protein [Rhodoferax antarcticus]|uniref:TniQ family protein n=1 Tax=Rhodoferax antarcticus TaxID=81479 RepID=UPI002225660A|nr:TniQ family protein [Rhodoferax antarcticus]MCW2313711.1 hypothetical protein [Rhodoferax antarcticus]
MQKDESVRGYVARVAHRNGSLGHVQQQLQSFSCASRSIPVFSELTGSPIEVLESHGSTTQNRTSKTPSVRFGNIFLPSNQVWQQRRYFCPLCLGADGISKGYWDLKIYSTCHRHRVRLVCKCSDCGRSFCWDTGLPDFCTCGLRISAVKTEAALPYPARRLFRLVALSFGRTVDFDSSTQITNRREEFLTLDWTLLLIEFIIFVLIPAFWIEVEMPDIKLDDLQVQTMIVKMLEDNNYRRILREAIFLHAANDPMTMNKALTPGNGAELIHQYYYGCIEGIPFHACLWERHSMMKWLQPEQKIKAKKQTVKSATQRPQVRDSYLDRRGIDFSGAISRPSYRDIHMPA